MSNPAQLWELRDYAMTCEGTARHFVDVFQNFTPSRDPLTPMRQATRQATALRQAERTMASGERAFDEMQEAMERWWNADSIDYIDSIKLCRGRKLDPITVGDATFATAHEAAYGLAEAVRDVWVAAGGDGPVDECERLRRGFDLVAMPANLYGHIEVEYHSVADDLALQEASKGQIPSPSGANGANTSALFPGGVPEDHRLVALAAMLQTNAIKPEQERQSNRAIARELTGETTDSWKMARSLLAQLNTIDRKNREEF